MRAVCKTVTQLHGNMLVRAENCMYVAGQALQWGLSEHSFLHRTMCLATSCWRIRGVSSLNHQPSLLAVFSSCCNVPRHLWKSLHWLTHSASVSLCKGLPATQQIKVKGQGSAMAGGSHTDVCSAHTLQSQAFFFFSFYFSHFNISLILQLFGPQVQNLSVLQSSVSLSTLT